MQEQAKDVQHSEAKVVAWAKFVDPHGATWSLTLREGATGPMAAELVANCEGLSAYLLRKGWTVEGAQVPSTGNSSEAHVCPIHNVEMKEHGKNGDTWYSHKLPDGGWCRGK